MSDSHTGISRRRFIQAGAGIAALGLGALSLPGGEDKPVSRRAPNILYVFSDMQRATSVGCYGDPNVHTPALDAFCKQGARFDAAMSNTPVCCPHRACLMTGLYSHHHGVVSNSVNFTRKARGLAERFRDAGYVTGYAGKWHIPPGYGTEDSMPLGFPLNEIKDGNKGAKRAMKAAHGHYVLVTVRDASGKEVEQGVYKPTVLADEAIRFIEEKSKGAAPWVFFLSWLPPHTPYKAPPEFRKHYEGALQLAPNVPKGAPADYARKVLPDYYGMVESLDAEFKRILEALNRSGAAEDTIVCYSSDHGDMLGSHGYEAKRWPHEESARVPFLIRYPRVIRAGQAMSDPFSTVDVFPTLAGLAGLKAPDGLDGDDYSPMLTGKSAKPPRDHVFLQMMYAYVPWPGWRALRTREFSYARRRQGPWLLHDIVKDPFQLKNLADDPASKPLLEEMDKRLAAIMKETGDSWDYKATTGDLDFWLPGGPKQKSQSLGVPWPKEQQVAADKEAGEGGKKNGKGGRKKAPNTGSGDGN
ncbi:MAG: sulfatase [Candidatus Sumerlaeota bacterium]|nr:sulfatase [Candidatus Sumerlaeota bacterium]